MRIPITDTYDAAMTAIIRQALAGEIDSNLAVKRINRARLMTHCARFGPVPENISDRQLRKLAGKLGLALYKGAALRHAERFYAGAIRGATRQTTASGSPGLPRRGLYTAVAAAGGAAVAGDA